VPLICSSIYFAADVWRRDRPRLHFAAREDMFERGFFAGFPQNLSLRARRLLYPLDAGPFLPRVRVYPVPYPSHAVLRLGRALEALPRRTALASVLPAPVVERLADRAQGSGLDSPELVGDVLRGEFADLLWTSYPREQLPAPALEEAWRERTQTGTEHLRRLVETTRAGAPMLVFPEGEPSPDGGIGPLRAGVRMLVRRAHVRYLLPIAVAYDHITCHRPYAYCVFGDSLPVPAEDVEECVLRLLRETVPLTGGQVVAQELRAAANLGLERVEAARLAAAAAAACEEAVAQGRPVATELRAETDRSRRLADALRFLVHVGLARRIDPRTLEIEPEQILADELLRRLARELESAREPVA
jgi:hypothetical protein